MSEYLDELIETLEAEEKTQRATKCNAGKPAVRRSEGQLNRTMQRLKSLRDLRSRQYQRALQSG